MVDRVSEIAGVYVKEIKVQTPPYDKRGIIQEYVGRAASVEKDYFPSEVIGKSKVSDTIESLKEMLPVGQGDYRVVYKLLVRARSERTAKMKARSYVRAVNPFSTDTIVVKAMGVTEDQDWLTDVGPLSEFHNVTVSVTK